MGNSDGPVLNCLAGVNTCSWELLTALLQRSLVSGQTRVLETHLQEILLSREHHHWGHHRCSGRKQWKTITFNLLWLYRNAFLNVLLVHLFCMYLASSDFYSPETTTESQVVLLFYDLECFQYKLNAHLLWELHIYVWKHATFLETRLTQESRKTKQSKTKQPSGSLYI